MHDVRIRYDIRKGMVDIHKVTRTPGALIFSQIDVAGR
jgi:hypothetical protein